MLAERSTIDGMGRHLLRWTLLTGVSLLLWASLALGFYFMLGGGF